MLFALALFLAYGAAVERFPALNLPPALSTAFWSDGWSSSSRFVAVDGDTLMAPEGGRFRLLGVDTPELHPCECHAGGGDRSNILLREGLGRPLTVSGNCPDPGKKR